jgi:cysteine desulfurase/selenocysteine lyase
VDVQDLDMDFLAFSGHKMIGPTGIGVFYGKKAVLEKMPPFMGGGEMIKEVSYNKNKGQCSISWNDLPWKFEAGTPNIGGTIGLAAAVCYLESLGMDNVFSHEKVLTKYAVDRMKECRNVSIYGPISLSQKLGIIPFGVRGFSSHEAAAAFNEYGIMMRSGFHCAQPLHEVFMLESSARISFYIYNNLEEVDRFIEVLKEFDQP